MTLNDIILDSRGQKIFSEFSGAFTKLIKKISCSGKTSQIYKSINNLTLQNKNINNNIKPINNNINNDINNDINIK